VAETKPDAVEAAPQSLEPPPEAKAAACPAGMQHVTASYCPDMKRECIDKEYDKPNRITICHAFREGKNDCQKARVGLDYCIDEFEFPNRAGEKPPVMVSFYDAEKSCADAGKRICKESEWVAACEGPEETPFPYGWRRSSEKCNFDNKWIDPSLGRVYSKDAEIQRAELARLDRSLPSGSRPECKSGFGVLDLTGNVDEWVRADVERENRRSRFAGLKGGAWGHVRNACRPVTTSHPPDFKYYFIGFRCCADAGATP
jgi:formylglycine-generating enzyme required for sulfatase activity